MKENNTLRSTLHLTIASVVFMISGYLINVVLGRLLGPGDYGIYSVLISLMTFLNIMQNSGIPQSVSKYVAEGKEKAEEIMASGLRVQLVMTTLIGLAFFLAAPLIAAVFKDPAFVGYARVTALIFPFYGTFALCIGYYNGLHNFRRQALIYIVYSISKMVFIIGLGVKFKLYGVIVGFIISPLIALLFGLKFPRTTKLFPYKPLILFSLPLIGFAALSTLQLSIDLFSVKSILGDARMTGYYAAAQNVALIPYFTMAAVGQILFPRVSHYLGVGKLDEAKQIIGRSIRYLSILLIPLATLIGASAQTLIQLLFGDKYLPAVTPLRILLVTYVLLTFFATLTNILNGAGRAKISMAIATLGVSIGFACCLVLIPHYGLNGAAIGTLIGAVVGTSCSLVATFRIFHFQIYLLSLFKVIVGSAIVFIGSILISSSAVLLPLEYIFLGILYFVALHYMGEISLEDRGHFKNLLPGWLPFTGWL